jgi:hypothetical protein
MLGSRKIPRSTSIRKILINELILFHLPVISSLKLAILPSLSLLRLCCYTRLLFQHDITCPRRVSISNYLNRLKQLLPVHTKARRRTIVLLLMEKSIRIMCGGINFPLLKVLQSLARCASTMKRWISTLMESRRPSDKQNLVEQSGRGE